MFHCRILRWFPAAILQVFSHLNFESPQQNPGSTARQKVYTVSTGKWVKTQEGRKVSIPGGLAFPQEETFSFTAEKAFVCFIWKHKHLHTRFPLSIWATDFIVQLLVLSWHWIPQVHSNRRQFWQDFFSLPNTWNLHQIRMGIQKEVEFHKPMRSPLPFNPGLWASWCRHKARI